MGFFEWYNPSHEMHEIKHENTKKRRLVIRRMQIVSSPVPHTKSTKINEIHEKGDRGGGKDFPSLKIIWWFLFLH